MIWVTPALSLGSVAIVLSKVFYDRNKVYKPFAKNIGVFERARRIGEVLCKDLP